MNKKVHIMSLIDKHVFVSNDYKHIKASIRNTSFHFQNQAGSTNTLELPDDQIICEECIKNWLDFLEYSTKRYCTQCID